MPGLIKTMRVFILILLCFLGLCVPSGDVRSYTESDSFSEKDPFLLLDFKKNGLKNTLGGELGVFDLNPYDKEAFCRMSFVENREEGKGKYLLRILYDVESSRPAFNGLWTRLRGLDLSSFEAVALTVRGMKGKKFSNFFKVELKDLETKMAADAEGITSDWQRIVIPFGDFEQERGDVDMRDLRELTLVFEDWRFEEKTGGYEIKEISFILKKGLSVRWADMVKPMTEEQEKPRIKMDVREKKEELLINILDDGKRLFDENRLSWDGKKLMSHVVRMIKKQAYRRVIIMMRTGKAGDPSYILSEKRARSILYYLANHGIVEKKIEYRLAGFADVPGKIDIVVVRWKEGDEERYRYHFYMGLDAYMKENYAEALREWEEAVKYDAENPDLRSWREKAKAAQKK